MVLRKFILCTFLILISHPSFASVIGGNSQGDITLVEFFDYQCPHCRNMSTTMDELIKQNPNLRVVYRMLPVINKTSQFEASATLAAINQNRFQNFHDLLIHQTETLSVQEILMIAKQIGLNSRHLKQDMKNPQIAWELNGDLVAAKNMNIHTIPTFLLGRTRDLTPKFRFDGEVSYAVLQNAILQLNQSR